LKIPRFKMIKSSINIISIKTSKVFNVQTTISIENSKVYNDQIINQHNFN
jgi:hypothetical protein